MGSLASVPPPKGGVRRAEVAFLDLCQLQVKMCFFFQFHYLPGYYQALLITGVVLLTVVEVVRLYLGYVGNLREKVIRSSFPAACLMLV